MAKKKVAVAGDPKIKKKAAATAKTSWKAIRPDGKGGDFPKNVSFQLPPPHTHTCLWGPSIGSRPSPRATHPHVHHYPHPGAWHHHPHAHGLPLEPRDFYHAQLHPHVHYHPHPGAWHHHPNPWAWHHTPHTNGVPLEPPDPHHVQLPIQNSRLYSSLSLIY